MRSGAFVICPKSSCGKRRRIGVFTPRFRQIVDDLLDVGGKIFVFGRADDQITLTIDTEITCAPIFDSVCFNRLFNN